MTTSAAFNLTLQRVVRTPAMPAAMQIRGWLRDVVAELALPDALDITLRICGVREARALNHEFRGKDYATNVLTFPYGSSADGISGDIVICAAVVADEARAQNKPLDAHFAHLAIHGLLHVLGYDHETAVDAAIMEPLEVRLLHRLGFADPYT